MECSLMEFGSTSSDENEHNVETEYEQKFAAKGQPIYKLTAHFKKDE